MHHIQYIIDVITGDENRKAIAKMIIDGEESPCVYEADSFHDSISREVNRETFEYEGVQTLELSFKGTYDYLGRFQQ